MTAAAVALVLFAEVPSVASGQVQAAAGDSVLKIIFFDVGQGDAALVRAPNGKKILIDAGPSPTVVAGRLRALKVDTLDLAVASHNHADHMGGMAAVVSSVVVRNYLENGVAQTTRTYANVVRALEQRRVPVLRPVPRQIDLGSGVTARVIVGPASASNQNDRSIGLLVTYGSFAALFTGDAEGRERSFWSDSAGLAGISLLKVAHHGSRNGTDPRFLRLLRPCAAVISVGNPNKFGHPAPRVLEILRTAKVRVFRTDEDGQLTVLASRDGKFTVTSESVASRSGSSVERIACATGASNGK